MGCWLCFSLGSIKSNFQYDKHQLIRVKALCRHQFDIFMFTELKCYLKWKILAVSLWRDINSLENAGLFVGFFETPWFKNAFRYNIFLILETSLDNKRCSVGTPIIWQFYLDCLLIYINILIASNLLDFHITPQTVFSYSCLSLYFPLLLYF